MSMDERSVWAQLVVLPLVGLGYFAVVLTRAARMPDDEVSWVVPMLCAMAIIVVGVVALTIASAIGHGVRATAGGEEPLFEDGDIRDKEIERYGEYRSRHFTAFGGLAVIVLAMLRVDHLWIASALFGSGILSGTYAATMKLVGYRRGF